MSTSQAWPPLSSHAALLTSPSGRNKYQQNSMLRSPLKKSATTPSLVDRLRAARSDNDIFDDEADVEDQDDDDEETLKLQLAAIEAKLKLKKLQQSKAKAEAGRDTPALSNGRPRSVVGTNSRIDRDAVQVGLSPTRRPTANLEPKSPNRVLLGIDKGLKASDVSLRRARSTTNNARATQGSSSSTRDRLTSRMAAFNSDRSSTVQSTPRAHVKSFSERVSEAGNLDRAKDAKRETSDLDRQSGFGLNKAEIETYKAHAEQHKPTSRSPTRTGDSRVLERRDSTGSASRKRGLTQSEEKPHGTRSSTITYSTIITELSGRTQRPSRVFDVRGIFRHTSLVTDPASFVSQTHTARGPLLDLPDSSRY